MKTVCILVNYGTNSLVREYAVSVTIVLTRTAGLADDENIIR